jgi:hypothetical protein
MDEPPVHPRIRQNAVDQTARHRLDRRLAARPEGQTPVNPVRQSISKLSCSAEFSFFAQFEGTSFRHESGK